MSKKRAITLLILVFAMSLWAAGCGLSNSNSNRGEPDESVFSAVDSYITNQMKAENIPGLAIGIVKDNRIIYLKGYGKAEPSGQSVTFDTPFVIGSTSKSITALAVMQLVEAGKIELDAPVQRYIPSFRVVAPQPSTNELPMNGDLFKDVSSSITVRHLLNQTSGLSQSTAYKTAFSDYNGDDALEQSARYYTEGAELKHPVGQTYEYSNGNYIILGLIVERVSGQSYESYVKEHIFTPLSMRNTFTSQEEAKKHGMATAYRRWFGFSIPYDAPYNRGDIPAGYIISTAEDMSHYLISQLEGGRYKNVSVLSPSGVNMMQMEPIPGTYAMGWESAEISGIPVIGHAGGTPGFQTHIWLDTEQHLGVIVLANVLSVLDAFPKTEITTATHLASGVMSLMQNKPLPDQGWGPMQMYWIVNAVVLLLSVWLVFSLIRVPIRYQRLSKNTVSGQCPLPRRVTIVFLLHFIWPGAVLLTAASGVALWKVLLLFQPDLIIWLTVIAIIIFLKGLIEIGLLIKTFKGKCSCCNQCQTGQMRS